MKRKARISFGENRRSLFPKQFQKGKKKAKGSKILPDVYPLIYSF